MSPRIFFCRPRHEVIIFMVVNLVNLVFKPGLVTNLRQTVV